MVSLTLRLRHSKNVYISNIAPLGIVAGHLQHVLTWIKHKSVCVHVCVGQACTGNHTWYVYSSNSNIKSDLNSKYQLVTQFAFYLLTFTLIVGAIKIHL